eukprot:scaffold6392_cov118-Isochrysis_galbana.AAC.1
MARSKLVDHGGLRCHPQFLVPVRVHVSFSKRYSQAATLRDTPCLTTLLLALPFPIISPSLSLIQAALAGGWFKSCVHYNSLRLGLENLARGECGAILCPRSSRLPPSGLWMSVLVNGDITRERRGATHPQRLLNRINHTIGHFGPLFSLDAAGTLSMSERMKTYFW